MGCWTDTTKSRLSPETTSPLENTGNIPGEVVSIDDKTYVIKETGDQKIEVEANSMTLIDESIAVGDKAEVRFSQDNQPIAIGKIRGI